MTDKCNSCIYYNYMYLICTKPYLVECPRESSCNEKIKEVNYERTKIK